VGQRTRDSIASTAMVACGRARSSGDAEKVGRSPAKVPPIETPVAVAFDAYPPDRRRRDGDNLIKAPLDCLVHAGLLLDDHLVRRVSLELHEADPPGRLGATRIGVQGVVGAAGASSSTQIPTRPRGLPSDPIHGAFSVSTSTDRPSG